MRAHPVMLVVAAVVAAAAPARAAPDAANVSVREVAPGVYRVDARFWVAVSAATARAVLTDYANLPCFLPDIRTSRVRARSDGYAQVEQEALSGYLLLSKRVYLLLEVHEEPDSITFRDTRHRSFRHYEGRWRITPHGGSTELTYELVAEPSFSVPNRLATRLLTRDASRMIERLRGEMVRRDAPESRHPPEPSCSSEERTR